MLASEYNVCSNYSCAEAQGYVRFVTPRPRAYFFLPPLLPITMKACVRIASSLSIAALGLSASVPAFAYVTSNEDITAAVVTSVRVSSLSSPRERALIHQARPITSREIERQCEKNVFSNSQERSEAVEDDTGRVLLPVRAAWRHVGLRNVNRHLLGAKRGGEWRNVEQFVQGDQRRRPLGKATESVNQGGDESVLPPTIVETGGSVVGRPTRRSIRGDRDLNFENRR